MNYIVDAQQMREIDRRTIEEIGIPALVLMERAAEAVAAQAEKMAEETGGRQGTRILAVCGAGGNGGDAAAAARILYLRGYSVELLEAFREEGSGRACSETAAKQLEIAENCGVPKCAGTGKGIDFSSYHILLDGIFGVGLSREITGKYHALIGKMNGSGAKILAVDIPSGIDGSTGRSMGINVTADCTVTFGERKLGQLVYPGAGACGALITADIGFPPFLTEEAERASDCAYLTYGREDIRRLPERSPRSHKGSCGRVLIFAGSEEITGAAFLASAAACRMGSGLVKLVSVPGCIDTVRRMLPEALMQKLPDAQEALYSFWKQQVEWADAVLAGPGLGNGERTRGALHALLNAVREGKKPLVLDADALNLLARELGESAEAGSTEAKEPGESAETDGTEAIEPGESAETDGTEAIEHGGSAEMGSTEAKEPGSSAETGGIMGGTMQERLERLSCLLPAGTVLTPHPKELSRLTGQPVSRICEHFVDTAKQCIYNNRLIYVLKDARTIVAGEGALYVNTSGCDGMATGGSGDVLAGMIAALLTGMEPVQAARLGVYLHGLAGENAAEERGCRGMLAGDIVEALRW